MNDLILNTKRPQRSLGLFTHVRSPGHGFFSVGGDGYVVFWPNELHENGKLIARSNKALYCCHYLPLQNLLVCGGLEGILYIIDLKQNKIISTTQIGVLPIYSIISTATHILSAHGDGSCTWNSAYSVESKIQLGQAIRTLLPDGIFYMQARDGFIYQQHRFSNSAPFSSPRNECFCTG
jgi:hypothetical protein